MNYERWYYLDGQEQKGPFGLEAMTQMLQAGVIKPETWVAIQGAAEWGAAGTLLASVQQNVITPASPPPASQRGNTKWMIAGAIALLLVAVLFSSNRSNTSHETTDAAEIGASFGNLTSLNEMPGSRSDGVCGRCNGRGRSGYDLLSCPSCSGQGTRTTPSGYATVCSGCGGSGRIPMTCEVCGGTGRSR